MKNLNRVLITQNMIPEHLCIFFYQLTWLCCIVVTTIKLYKRIIHIHMHTES